MRSDGLHPFDHICAVLRARLHGTQPPADVTSAFLSDPGMGLVWAALASRHRITPALAASFADLGLMEHLPTEFRTYLEAMRVGNSARNEALREQLMDLVGRLNGRGIAPCLLKGAARLVDGLFPSDDWRFMVDLDLLVPGERMSDCVDALFAAGYATEEGTESIKPHRHYPSLVHPEQLGQVELHRHLGRPVQRLLLPTEELWARAQPLSTPAGHVRVLAPADQMIHLIAHLQVDDGHWFQGLTRLSELVELDLLMTRYSTVIDWPSILYTLDRSGYRRACLTVPCAASRLLGTALPEVVRKRLDWRIHLATTRIVWQERCSLMMRIGHVCGWTAWQLHRLMVDPEHRRRAVRSRVGGLGPQALVVPRTGKPAGQDDRSGPPTPGHS